MAYTTYAILPGMLGLPSMPIQAPVAHTPSLITANGPKTVSPIKPIYVVNGNGVTLVTGSDAAGGRPGKGQLWPRGTHVVLSQFATQYAGVGQR